MKKKSTSNIEIKLKDALDLCLKGRIDEAREIYMTLMHSFPKHPDILSNLGVIELQLGNIQLGIEFLEKSLLVNSFNFQTILNLANAYLELSNYQKSIHFALLAIQINKKSVEGYFILARALYGIENYDEAIKNYDQVIKLDKHYVNAYINRGLCLYKLFRYQDAITTYREAIRLNPNYAEAYYNEAISFHALKSYQEAIASYNEAIRLNPNYAEAYNNLGITLNEMYCYDEAILNHEKAIALKPNYANAFYNLAINLAAKKDYDLAILNYKKTLELEPSFHDAKNNLGLIYLTRKQFLEGWPLYEERFKLERNKHITNLFQKTYLNNIKIKGKKIIIYGDQGLGDQIFYSRFLDELVEHNFIILLVDERLIPLFKRTYKKIDRLLPLNYPIDELDYDEWLPLSVIPKFYIREINDFNLNLIEPLLTDIGLTSKYKADLKNNNQLICGLSWKSKNETVGAIKSIVLEELLPILSIPNIVFVNLQYGNIDDELKIIKEKYNIDIKIINEIDNYTNIDGLASIINSCDFVVTSSNVTAHIAGALEKETYVLLPYSDGKIYYWHEGYGQSFWYPSLQLFSQGKLNNWSEPMENISFLIKEKINDRFN
jgi:tetratricopeptide (TPR) repeat protein